MHPMFAEGLNLMLMGLGVVFAFLALLVGIVTLMSRLVVHLAPEQAPPVQARPMAPVAPVAPAHGGTSPVDATTLAVIREAIRQHRAGAR